MIPVSMLMRLQTAIIAGGVAIDGVDVSGKVSPTSMQSAAQATINAFDQSNAAHNTWLLAQDRTSAADYFTNAGVSGKAARALAVTINDRSNVLALKINAILDAIDAATTLANLKTAVLAIADVQTVTIAQAKAVAISNANTGAGD